MKIRPINKNILIELIRKENKSLIVIPEGARKEKPSQGKVLAIGDQVKQVKVGDIVAFNYARANFFEGEGELDANIAKRVFIKEEDIYLKI